MFVHFIFCQWYIPGHCSVLEYRLLKKTVKLIVFKTDCFVSRSLIDSCCDRLIAICLGDIRCRLLMVIAHYIVWW